MKPKDQEEEEDTGPFKKWEDVLEHTDSIPGYFTVHRKRDNTLSAAAWMELGGGTRAPRAVNSFRRNLQRSHLNGLVDLLISRSPVVPEDARSLARYELRGISERIATALSSGALLDVATRAHLEESKARIDRALEASMTVTVRED
ncbi:MAG: hypothetical protein ACE5PT_05480 [Gemmatimonadales bacterium]